MAYNPMSKLVMAVTAFAIRHVPIGLLLASLVVTATALRARLMLELLTVLLLALVVWFIFRPF